VKIIGVIALVFTLFSFKASGFTPHDIHISVCELRYNESTDAFEVSLKIFIDDLELALARDGVTGLGIGTPKELPAANDKIAAYLSKHFKIQLGGQVLSHEFLGKEISEDYLAVWCYIQLKANPAAGQQCSVTNDILFEMYDDQKTLMDVRMTKTHKEYVILQPDKATWNYTY
jgi:hypothetical protein